MLAHRNKWFDSSYSVDQIDKQREQEQVVALSDPADEGKVGVGKNISHDV